MFVAGALTKEDIPFVPAVGTMMLWMDLRKGLRGGNTWEAEQALWKRLADNRHVILTPGHLPDICCLVMTHSHSRLDAYDGAATSIRSRSVFGNLLTCHRLVCLQLYCTSYVAQAAYLPLFSRPAAV